MSDDLIKRSDAIKATWQEPTYTDPLNVLTEVRDRIEAIPSADRPQGEWIHSHEGTIAEGLYCSNCGKHGYGEKFCPNCRAKMEVADRPQGKWKSVKASIYPYGYDVECSVCGHRMGSSFGYKFCPHCGARMKGADDE